MILHPREIQRIIIIRVQVGTGFIVASQRDGNAVCQDTLAGLPGLSFLPVPPWRYPRQPKYAGTFSPGTQHAGTAVGGTRYSKMCWYFLPGMQYAGN